MGSAHCTHISKHNIFNPQSDKQQNQDIKSQFGKSTKSGNQIEQENEVDDEFLYGENLLFPWDPEKLCLGVDTVDSQHKVLVKIINQLDFYYRTGNKSELMRVFDHLISYTDFHFKTEEDMMDKYNYQPQRAAGHKSVHKRFVEKVFSLRESVSHNSEAVAKEALDFLKEWLTSHILVTDKKLCAYIKSKQNDNGARSSSSSLSSAQKGSTKVLNTGYSN